MREAMTDGLLSGNRSERSRPRLATSGRTPQTMSEALRPKAADMAA